MIVKHYCTIYFILFLQGVSCYFASSKQNALIECIQPREINNFTSQSDFLLDKQKILEKCIEEYQAIQSEFKTAKERLANAKNQLNKAKEFTYEEWEANNRQMSIEFAKEEGRRD